MKERLAALILITLVLTASLTIGPLKMRSASAKTNLNASTTAVATAAAVQGVTLPKTNIYALTSDNMIFVLAPGKSVFSRVGTLPNGFGNLIGIDFRVSNNSLYGLTDTGKLLLLNPASSSLSPTLVTTLTPRFAGGFQSLLDFNPVVDAIRIIGSNDQNYAVVSANGGNLNTTAVQTSVAYATGDTNAGTNPNIVGGAYNNNFVGATNTIFYMIDYDLDTFVTIATKNATGSSNTGGGQLQTIGSIVDASGAPLNLNPTVDFDIFTDANRVNTLVGLNNKSIFTINLNQINPNLQLGTTQRVVANSLPLTAFPTVDSFIDIALQPQPAAR